MRVIQRFSEEGDELCKAVERFLDTVEVYERDVFLYGSEIPKKLLRRTMTRKEYEGYLNGTLPISTTHREKYFLPHRQEN